MKTAHLATLGLLAVACSTAPDGSQPAASSSSLPPGIAATVGTVRIGVDAVASVAASQQISPDRALSALIEDALFSSGAEQRGLGVGPVIDAALRGVLARARLQKLKEEAGGTEPDDAEVAEATLRHFVEYDRPEAFRVMHALVKLPDKADAAQKARASSVADRLAEHIAPAHDETDFKALADSFADRGDFELVVETLKPTAADGRIVDIEHPSEGAGRYLLPFARAASHLSEPGQKSGVVATDFGFHVMMLLERSPAQVVPLEDRRRLLREDIVTERARRLKKELLQRLRADRPPITERSADALLPTLDNAPNESP